MKRRHEFSSISDIIVEMGYYKLGLIESGTINDQHNGGKAVKYEVVHGLNSTYAINADLNWMSFTLSAITKLKTEAKSEDDFIKKFTSYQFEDKHWSWINKSVQLSGSEYEWFYFIVDSNVEGICNIYHPKASRIDNNDIFYIEYVAAAPWNRKNPLCQQRFKGIGTLLIKASLNYSINVLHYRPGFSLHSLPQSTEYYDKIGMKSFGADNSYHNLLYYEMEQGISEVFANA